MKLIRGGVFDLMSWRHPRKVTCPVSATTMRLKTLEKP
jgi:hypothetical protein